MELMNITDEEFKVIRDLIYKQFGIHLTEQKKSLVVGRLQKAIREKGFQSFSDYFRYLSQDKSGRAVDELATKISTNHTFFFREKEHFDFFQKTALPQIVNRQQAKNNKDLRIWSAGCSSGEEGYTIIMLMLEFFGSDYKLWNAGLLGTDISARALEQAAAGIYPEERLALMPEMFRRKYFEQRESGDWAISPIVKKEAVFRRLNLMNESFPFKRQFDMIFCRNVMIYFDQVTKDRLVQRFYDWTAPGGYFFIGHSESLPRERCPYRYIMPALYQKEER